MPVDAGIRQPGSRLAAGPSKAIAAPPARPALSARLLLQAGALVRCHVSEGQEDGRAESLEMLVFGQPGSQGPQQDLGLVIARHGSARALMIAGGQAWGGWEECGYVVRERAGLPGKRSCPRS